MGAMKDLAIDQMNLEREKQAAKALAILPKTRTEPFKRSRPFPQRNQLCPCGSGKKFKHCHEIEYRLKLQKAAMEARADKKVSK